jgi:23S rRNA (pseudouridine1915-N3)-methyltransferase
MKLVCLVIGKNHDPAIAAAIEDYTKRLSHYAPLAWQILAPAKGKMSTDEVKRAESAQLLAKIEDDDYVVLLDERGTELSSRGVAEFLSGLEDRSVRRAVFVIGGAFGIDDRVSARADFTWALSELVFPHQLVRLILAEQLYRANTIRRGEPYHHE